MLRLPALFGVFLALASLLPGAFGQNRPELIGPAYQGPKPSPVQKNSFVSAQPQPKPAPSQAAPVRNPTPARVSGAQANTGTPRNLLPLRPPRVSYNNGLLTIVAENSTLADVLNAVRQRTGTVIEAPPSASTERVVISIGPAPANSVLMTLLNGSRFDYIILGSQQALGPPQQLILREKQATGQAGAVAGNTGANPGNMPAIASAPRVPAEAPIPEQEEEFVPDAEIPDEAQPEAQPEGQPGQAQQQPGQPQVKTPEQLLQELQQMQQQQQQQQQGNQPGSAQPGGEPNLRPQSNDEFQRHQQQQQQQQPQMQPQQMPPDNEAPPE